jgi:hypothetical protein
LSRQVCDARYNASDKGRAREHRYNQRPFRKLMQCERNAQRRAIAGYVSYRLIFGEGVTGPDVFVDGRLYTRRLSFGILTPENETLTPEQKVAWQEASKRTRNLKHEARRVALDRRHCQEIDAFEMLHPEAAGILKRPTAGY